MYPAPATIGIAASASSNVSGGSIAKVEFYANGSLLSSATAAPYAFNWANVQPGPYIVTAKATDNLSVSATSSPITVIVTAPLSPPTVSLSAPAPGAEFALGQAVTMIAQGTTPGRAIDHFEFYGDGVLLGSIPVPGGFEAANAQLSWPGATLGAHTLSAKVVATDGTNASSTAVNIAVSDLAVTLLEPAQGQTYQAPAFIRMTASVSESVGTIARVDFYVDGVVMYTLTTPPYTVGWPNVGIGSHIIKAVTRDASGLASASNSSTISVISTPMLQVAPGLDGATVSDDNISIFGTTHASVNSAVTVNGHLAWMLADGSFGVDNIDLQPGSNTLAVVVSSQDAAPITQTITVSSAGVAPFQVYVDPPEGLAPFTTTLTISNRTSAAFQRIEVDTNGDGVPDIVLTRLQDNTAALAITYPDAGMYLVGVKVFDASNNLIYSALRKILVRDPGQVALGLVSIYMGMLDRLSFGDITGALNAISVSMRDKYDVVFTALQGQMPSIVSQLRTIQDAIVNSEIAELHVTRTTSNGPQTFSILFMRDEDGVWRIEGM